MAVLMIIQGKPVRGSVMMVKSHRILIVKIPYRHQTHCPTSTHPYIRRNYYMQLPMQVRQTLV